MEPRARYVLVGVSLLALVGAAVYFGFWLFGSGQGGDVRTYTILFRDVSLTGLREDSEVTFHGIRVGRIQSIEIPKEDIEVVRLTVDIQQSIPVKTDTRATVRSHLLTGVAAIDLEGSTQESAELSEIPPGEEYPVIIQGISGGKAWEKDLPETLRAVTETTRTIGVLAANLDGFLTRENREAVSETLDNLRSISSDLAGKTGRLEKLLDQVGKIAQDLRKAIGDLQNPNSPIGKAIINTADIVSRETTNISADVARLSRKLGAASRTLEDPREALFGAPKNAGGGPGEKRK